MYAHSTVSMLYNMKYNKLNMDKAAVYCLLEKYFFFQALRILNLIHY